MKISRAITAASFSILLSVLCLTSCATAPTSDQQIEDPLPQDPTIEAPSSNAANDDVDASSDPTGGEIYYNSKYGVSFYFPSGWTHSDPTEDADGGLCCTAYAHSTSADSDYPACTVQLAAFMADEVLEIDLTEQFLEEFFSDLFPDYSYEPIEQVKLGENDYWKISGSGTFDGMNVRVVLLMHIDDDRLFTFSYVEYDEKEGPSCYRDFESMAAFTVF